MTKLVRMAEYKARPGFVQFERAEISQLLALYATRVADGDWRDYAIDLGPERAVFAVFRHSWDRPAFTIAKTARDVAWVLSSGGRVLAKSRALGEVLAALSRPLKPV
jgi:hypothetical protein